MLKHARVLLVGLVLAAVVLPASSAGAVAGYGDVAEGRYFTDPVQWSVDGDVTGLDGACFEPDRLVSRGEMAVWLWNMEGQLHAAAPHSFDDVTDPGHHQPVSWLLAEGITTGTTPTTFSPDNGLTRGQFAAFLWRLAGQPSAAAHSFGDVVATWQQGPVSWLLAEGITTGTTATTFSPDNGLTRGQLVTFLYRYNGEPTVTIDPDSPTCTPPATFKTVTAGDAHLCAISTDDTITCWGWDLDVYSARITRGLTDAPSGTFKTATAGGAHSCAISTDDTIICWGSNYYGQSDEPSGTFKTVTSGSQHSCAIRSDDTIICWGSNDLALIDAPSGTFKTVTAGGEHSCAISTDDTITCWGQPLIEGGEGDIYVIERADAPSGTFKTVTAGGGDSCGLRSDDTIACWDRYGLIYAPSGTFKTVTAGGAHSCAIRSDDTIACWDSDGPDAPPSGTFKTVTAGKHHSCAIRSDDTIACWDSDGDTRTDAPSGTFKAVATAGRYSACAIRSDDTIACWERRDIPRYRP